MFNSIPFFIFMGCVVLVFHAIPSHKKSVFLLIVSFGYYFFLDSSSIAIIIFSIYFDFILAIMMAKRHGSRKKILLAVGIANNIGLLFWFKYYSMFHQPIVALLEPFGITLPNHFSELTIPLGLSFLTFKKMSYQFDVYRNQQDLENKFIPFSLYILMFLQVIAGPIDRAKQLLPQLKNNIPVKINEIYIGLFNVLCGLCLKIVIADRLALYSNLIFNNITNYKGLTLLLAAYFYTFQIYADFAGYTLMAIGFGKCLGYNFSSNFKLPYFSESISEFWRKWHITLSYWFRDYLYIPLGGNRKGRLQQNINVMIVFLLCGLWHGANWTFVAWGGIHGLYLVAGNASKKIQDTFYRTLHISSSLKTIFQIIHTFHLIMFAWVFFRANNLADAVYFYKNLFVGWPEIHMDANAITYGAIGVVVFVLVELCQFKQKLSITTFIKMPLPLRWTCIYVLIFSIFLAGVDSDTSFIYVQF